MKRILYPTIFTDVYTPTTRSTNIVNLQADLMPDDYAIADSVLPYAMPQLLSCPGMISNNN